MAKPASILVSIISEPIEKVATASVEKISDPNENSSNSLGVYIRAGKEDIRWSTRATRVPGAPCRYEDC